MNADPSEKLLPLIVQFVGDEKFFAGSDYPHAEGFAHLVPTMRPLLAALPTTSIEKILVMIDRGDYWQCGFVIPKGTFEEIQQRGLPSFRDALAGIAPFVRDRVKEVCEWSDLKLLTVRVDHLRQWYRPGILCIGDAAHAMSPIGGIGINLAIQDAVAAANLLAVPLRDGAVAADDLRKVQHRRELPTRLTQRLQVFIQERVIRPVLSSRTQLSLPWPLRLLRRWPWLRRLPARLIGLGFCPEHVKTPDIDSRNLSSTAV